jgi:hypothetical protein
MTSDANVSGLVWERSTGDVPGGQPQVAWLDSFRHHHRKCKPGNFDSAEQNTLFYCESEGLDGRHW